MYVITVKFVVKPQHLNEFLPAMHKQADDSLTKEANCHYFDVCQGEEDKNTIFLYELYASKADFEYHLDTEHFKSFAAKVQPWVESKEVLSFNKI
ncbi:antibiotic biosynthesis monooxygenase [Saccharobesus litoralis]|uniref:Antibiotic biosynthesis monooxygenase n=1 Tax=Saccharobesus litoralis TaxID=2172099 RepID=A0A2S0VP47_9ALTE|nr:putative quinol monooxygenase [Saccharobesus litoralis]AWB65860.1 antibiotic biosynthesis monooxygenase [Saccharobesus litoralis]